MKGQRLRILTPGLVIAVEEKQYWVLGLCSPQPREPGSRAGAPDSPPPNLVTKSF